MDAGTFKEVKKIFQEAMEKDPADQAKFLDQACKGDERVRRQVEDMLGAMGQSSSFIETPAYDSFGPSLRMGGRSWEGGKLGAYSIKKEIGAGGMGVVFEAERDHPKQVVALKVMLSQAASLQSYKRFEQETKILAGLSHPGIARIFDAGIYDDGEIKTPYFVMELIPNSINLIEYANLKNLGMRDRLKLFYKVCAAVHHGHSRGVIHRDLKPANILVDGSSGLGAPKVIDFGVARRLDSNATITQSGQNLGQIIGSLKYMSPEQCSGSREDVDIQSDLYSLGVVLYELLSGRLPYDLSNKTITETMRIISKQSPIRLSEASPSLRDDIETITMKALEKDRDRRYLSVKHLAKDIWSYLHSKPIEARRPNLAYHAGLFAKRNKIAVISASLVLLVLILAAGVSVSLAMKGEKENLQAQDRAARAERVSGFWRTLLMTRGALKTMDNLLDQGVKKAEQDFPDAPELRAKMFHDMGRAYLNLGQYEKAKALLTRSAEFYQGDDGRSALSCRVGLGRAKAALGEDLEAQRLLKNASLLLGDRDPLLLEIQVAMAEYHQRRQQYRLAETLLKEAERGSKDDLDRLYAVCGLARMYGDKGDLEKSEQYFKQAILLQDKLFGAPSPELARGMEELADFHQRRNQPKEAVKFLKKALAGFTTVFKETDSNVLRVRKALGALLGEGGRLLEAIVALKPATKLKPGSDPKIDDLALELAKQYSNAGAYGDAEVQVRTLIAFHADSGSLNAFLADLLSKQTRFIEAEIAARRALQKVQREFGADHENSLRSQNALALILLDSDQGDKAIDLFRKSAAQSEKQFGKKHGLTLECQQGLAQAHMKTGNMQEAWRLLNQVLDQRLAGLGEDHQDCLILYDLMGDWYAMQGERKEALPLKTKALKGFQRILGADHAHTTRLKEELAQWYEESRKYEKALPLAKELMKSRWRILGADHSKTLDSMVILANLYLKMDRKADAEAVAMQALESLELLNRDPKLKQSLLDRVEKVLGDL